MDEVAAILLAGGASRRMGRDKAALPLAGEALAARVHRVLAAACGEVLVVSNHAFPVAGARVVPDAQPGRGPLEGLATGLEQVTAPRALVAACDMPLLRPALLHVLLAVDPCADAVVPRTAHGLEPLLAVYAARVAPALRAALARGERSLRGALAGLAVVEVPEAAWRPHDPAGDSFLNLNRPEDLAVARGRLAALGET